jgi:hypothetical protein
VTDLRGDQTIRITLPRTALWRLPPYLLPGSPVQMAAARLMREAAPTDAVTVRGGREEGASA